MKKLYAFLLFFIGCSKGFSQGTDIIFWLDNSGSITETEYNNMKISVDSIMEKVLSCNSKNRVTVIQYAAPVSGGAFVPKIKIETDFTDTIVPFTRAPLLDIGNYDLAHESLGLIGKALDHIPDANILGTQTTLNRTLGNKLAIYFFTDALRDDTTGSLLVNKDSLIIGSNGAFHNYTDFKTSREATFIVTMVPSGAETFMPGSDIKAKRTGAAISSRSTGGTYILGDIEYYPADPDGPASLPRFFLYKTSFSFTPIEINAISDQLCSVVQVPCPEHLVLTSPTHDVHAPIQDNRQVSISITASNQINAKAVGIYHAGSTIVLKPGFHSKNSSRFRAYIEGCSDKFVGREAGLEEKQKMKTESKSSRSFLLYPNPATQKATIEHDQIIKNIQIMSIDGKIILTKEVGANLYEIDLSNYKKGLYLVTVQTGDGKILTHKLVKN